jgi:dTDP-glucose 4,6-dehydratase
MHRAIGPTQIHKELGSHPRESLEQGADRSVNWHLDNEGWLRALEPHNGAGKLQRAR